MFKSLSKRLNGYRRRIAHEWWILNINRSIARNYRLYDRWVDQLQSDQPDVFIGSDFEFGGVRNHIRAIKAHSSLNIRVVPDESAMRGLRHFDVHVQKRFMDFVPIGNPVVHSHVSPWMIQWCMKQHTMGSRWIHTYHLPYFPDHGKTELEPWQIEINQALIHQACHADVRLSVAKWQSDYLISEHGIETIYLPNGVDVAACDRGDSGRFQYSSGVNTPFVLHVSRNDPVKNPAEFVRLAARHPDLRFVVIGDGLDETVMARVWQTSTPSNLQYLGGRCHAEVQDALAACLALVVTSKREGLPTLVLEAMSHGKPVVVPEEAGCLEAIDHGRYGFSYPLGDLVALSSSLHNALSDTERCTQSRQRIMDHYDWRVVARQLDAFYS